MKPGILDFEKNQAILSSWGSICGTDESAKE